MLAFIGWLCYNILRYNETNTYADLRDGAIWFPAGLRHMEESNQWRERK